MTIQIPIILAVLSLLFSCEKNKTAISSFNSSKSHNMGQDCMSCHKKGGSGEGRFSSAGTVYNNMQTTPIGNRKIKLYTGPNSTGSLIKTIEVDAQGNFYTTEKIDFSVGLYPSIIGNSTTKHMSVSTSTGNCMSCHGISTSKIWGD